MVNNLYIIGNVCPVKGSNTVINDKMCLSFSSTFFITFAILVAINSVHRHLFFRVFFFTFDNLLSKKFVYSQHHPSHGFWGGGTRYYNMPSLDRNNVLHCHDFMHTFVNIYIIRKTLCMVGLIYTTVHYKYYVVLNNLNIKYVRFQSDPI